MLIPKMSHLLSNWMTYFSISRFNHLWKTEGIAVSVITITRNRSTYLDLFLTTLEKQILPANLWEAVIIDNASQDDTEAVCQKHTSIRQLIYQKTERSELAPLLNKALGIAKGYILIFVSDDQLLLPDFMFQHLVCQLKKTGVVLGDNHRSIYTHIFPLDELEPGCIPHPFIKSAEVDKLEQLSASSFPSNSDYAALFTYFETNQQSVPYPWACFSLSNASVPRRALSESSGFDERFTGCDLTVADMAYRLHAAGWTYQFSSQARAISQITPKQRVAPRDAVQNIVRFRCKFPEMTPNECALIEAGPYYSAQ